MNFGILMVQGLVNCFGTAVMAAFAAAVKIDTLAYSPVQDFGNAFSTFVAQNHGAGKAERIREGGRKAVLAVLVFGTGVSALVVLFAGELMRIFTTDAEIIGIGISYLRMEGAFYGLNRTAVFVLWIFSCRRAAHDFCDSDGHIVGEQGAVSLCAVRDRGGRLPWDLDEYTDRMGACGCGGIVFFEKEFSIYLHRLWQAVKEDIMKKNGKTKG